LYGDVIQEIDWSVGRIISTLKELDLEKKTLVIFTTDNGPWLIFGEHGGSAGPLRDGKGSSYEGGQRVPCIMQWTGTIPAGSRCDSFATTLDILPTLASLTGAALPADLIVDGGDISVLVLGQKGSGPVYDFFLYDREEAIRVGNWKYRKGPEIGIWGYPSHEARRLDTLPKPDVVQLFNLKEDPGEKNNLATLYPEKVEELDKLLIEKLAQIKKK
jgi:arylsulfatase A-like enzyme